MKVIIIGLGYVGLPIAITFAKEYDTYGFDINKKKYKNIKKELIVQMKLEMQN